MNSVINPGVKLGARTIVTAGNKSQKASLKARTIVTAGNIVTKSFPESYCVIASLFVKNNRASS